MLKEYLKDFDLEIVVLLETRISGIKVENVIWKIRLRNSHRVEARGFSGGVWILCKCNVEVSVVLNTFQFVHLKV